ncbi:MAG: fused MFS/spermidine synthase, partial [Acidimicrobiia bacterium]
ASMRTLPDESADIVVGDAFGGRAVPWHLTTVEFNDDIDRVLRTDGLYIANVIDGPRMELVRAVASTLGQTWPHVAVLTTPDRLVRGGNLVVAASHARIDSYAVIAENLAFGLDVIVLAGTDLDAFVDGAQVLTDDHAPVDQLLG